MLKSYFKIALRKLNKNRLYSFVDIFGLCTGITSCILIALYINDELSFDRFNKNASRIVRVTTEFSDVGTVTKTALTSTIAGPMLKRSFPAVEDFVRVFRSEMVVTANEKAFDEPSFLHADASFFNIFSVGLLKGNAGYALNGPGRIVLTEKTAIKYFGNDNVIGKTLKLADGTVYEITGIAEDAPPNSQVQFSSVASFSTLDASKTEDWWTDNYETYLLLHQPSQVATLQKGITSFMAGNGIRREALGNSSNTSDYLTYGLEPLLKIHLFSRLNDGFVPTGNIQTVYILTAIALLILVIACVNYTNLSTAHSAARGPEIGIRKVLGAQKKQLFAQFIGEAFLVVFSAFLISLFICSQVVPLFDNITGKSLSVWILFQPLPFAFMALFIILISLAAGGYPAFMLSGFNLVKILKSGFRLAPSGTNMRKTLIVFQFTVSVFLIIATIVIIQQFLYMRNSDLGYDKDHIVILPVDNHVNDKYTRLEKAISIVPGVISAAGASETPVMLKWSKVTTMNGSRMRRISTGKVSLSLQMLSVDLGFITTMNMKILDGKDFAKSDFLANNSGSGNNGLRYSYILNETAAKAFGWTPEEATGKIVYRDFPGQVKAVIKDFHFSSFREVISPIALMLDTGGTRLLFVKVSGKNIPDELQSLKAVWKQYEPERPFDYHFLDEDFGNLYTSERNTAKIFTVFSSVAILLSCLGLLALAAYTIVQHTKEIGIRKVLGASVADIITLISKGFMVLVFTAIIIAAPASWWAMHAWLNNFAYRIQVEWWVFAVSGILVLMIALFTVGLHAVKAAMMNPVKSLRSE